MTILQEQWAYDTLHPRVYQVQLFSKDKFFIGVGVQIFNKLKTHIEYNIYDII